MPKQALQATEGEKMAALVSNQQTKYKLSQEKIKNEVQIILNALGSHDGELSLLIVDDEQIAKLNKTVLCLCGFI